jgi:hypothetical protein
MNLTRNVRIEGTAEGHAHVHIMAMVPQHIAYAAFRYLGVKGVLGRYPVHFHMAGNMTRGSKVVGCVVRDSGMHAFWPHSSNGITFRDCVAYTINEEVFGWDDEDRTNDIVWDHCLAANVTTDQHRMGAFMLGVGKGNVIRDSVAIGIHATEDSGAFNWIEKDIHAPGTWKFPAGNVAHNNECNGALTWQNTHDVHPVVGFLAYRNGSAGINHGAYSNDYHYIDCRLLENETAGVVCHADSHSARDSCRFVRLVIDSSPIGFQKLESSEPGEPILVCSPKITGTQTEYDLQGPTAVDVRTNC